MFKNKHLQRALKVFAEVGGGFGVARAVARSVRYRTNDGLRPMQRPVPFVATALVATLFFGFSKVGTAAPVEDTIAQRVLACSACHGPEGRAAPDGYQPRIAGKPAGYLFNQLQNFREGRRRYGPMVSMVDHLGDAYLREIAQHFAGLKLPYAAPPAPRESAAVLERGRLLATQGDPARKLPACSRCHGEALTGALPAIPGLLGLPTDYVAAQIGAWRGGDRHAQAPDCMAEVARKLEPGDVAALAAWLASRPVPATPIVEAATLTPLPLECGGLAK